MNKEEKTITLGNELYEEFIKGKQTIDTHELLNLFAKRINNLQSKIDKAIEFINKYEYQRYCPNPYEKDKYIMSEEKEGQYLLDILKEDK